MNRGGEYLLDTTIVIAILNQNLAIKEKIEGKTIYLSSIVVGELYYGVYKSTAKLANLRKLETFLDEYSCLDCTLETSEQYGKLKLALSQKGRPIPENDLWLAAQSIEHELILVTTDPHFQWIDGLKIETW